MYVIFAVIFILLLYLLQLNVYAGKWDKNLKTEAYFGVNEVFEGEEAELTESLTNEKLLPLPMVKLKLQLSRELIFKDTDNSVVSDYFNRTDIYSVVSWQKVVRTMKFMCRKRGYYTFRGVEVVGSNLFFTKEYIKNVDSPSYLYVFPKLYNPGVLEPVLNRVNGETLTKRNLVEDPFELRGIREYQPYDGMKNINWKASAKTDDFMVNVHDYTSHRTIKIFADLDKATMTTRDEILELLISMTAACTAFYAKTAVPVRVSSNGRDILTGRPLIIGEGSGENFLRNVNRALAKLDLTQKNADFNATFREELLKENDDSYSIIFAVNMQDELQDLLSKMKDNGRDFCWVCPAYRDDQLKIRESLKENCMMIKAEEALYELSLS